MERAIRIKIMQKQINLRDKAMQAAVGYLCTWGNQPKCDIYVGVDEMTAHYCKESGEVTFVIGAIFRDDKWEFHS